MRERPSAGLMLFSGISAVIPACSREGAYRGALFTLALLRRFAPSAVFLWSPLRAYAIQYMCIALLA